MTVQHTHSLVLYCDLRKTRGCRKWQEFRCSHEDQCWKVARAAGWQALDPGSETVSCPICSLAARTKAARGNGAGGIT